MVARSIDSPQRHRDTERGFCPSGNLQACRSFRRYLQFEASPLVSIRTLFRWRRILELNCAKLAILSGCDNERIGLSGFQRKLRHFYRNDFFAILPDLERANTRINVGRAFITVIHAIEQGFLGA